MLRAAEVAARAPLAATELKKSRSAVRHLTRSELLESRRKRSREYEEKQYGDYEQEAAAALARFTLETQRAGPKIFEATSSDVVVQDKTWTDRTQAERGSEIRTLRNRQAETKMQARVGQGLSKYPDQGLDFARYQRTCDPEAAEANRRRDFPLSLKYVKKPLVISQKQLLLNRKQDHREKALVCKKVVDDGTHKDEIVRLAEREAARTELLQQRNAELLRRRGLTQAKTRTQLDADRKAQTAMEVSVKADVPRTGVHPVRLPLFSHSIATIPAAGEARAKSQGKMQSGQAVDHRRHWEFRAGYVANPTYVSRVQMLQDRKYWAKNDPLLLGDLTLEENP